MKGNFDIIINDNLSICSKGYKEFYLVHKGTFFTLEYNQEIFDKMVEIVVYEK